MGQHCVHPEGGGRQEPMNEYHILHRCCRATVGEICTHKTLNHLFSGIQIKKKKNAHHFHIWSFINWLLTKSLPCSKIFEFSLILTFTLNHIIFSIVVLLPPTAKHISFFSNLLKHVPFFHQFFTPEPTNLLVFESVISMRSHDWLGLIHSCQSTP